MKLIQKNQARPFKNSAVCTAYEYPLGDPDINGAVIELNGRYPDEGRVVNNVCKELVYVIRGSGKAIVEGNETPLHTGDMMLILPGEKYYFDGELVMLLPCTPAWYPEQHEYVDA